MVEPVRRNVEPLDSAPAVTVEVLPQATPLYAVNERGSFGLVIGWRWWRERQTSSDVIAQVHCDPVVVWDGQGGAFAHPGVGGQGTVVACYLREQDARRAAGAAREARATRRMSS